MKNSLRRRFSFVLLGLMLFGAVMAGGCGQQSANENQEPSQTGSELSGSLTLAGSTSVQPFSEVLAEEFMTIHPDVQVNVQGGGSSQGVAAAISGAADIGAASRDLKDEEKEAEPGIKATVIAIDGVSIVVHPENPIPELTIAQVKDIYLGNIVNWKELGGNDAVITVICREDGSGTRDAFDHIVMSKERSVGTMRRQIQGE
ncbi:MAG: phosphate ABC transporter substrate-binding protein [Bacillota bacterium]|nr:phosphate ABC transporter substrate-binding protein [Bacillota bacterium]